MAKKKRTVQKLTAKQRAEYRKKVAEEDHDVLREQAREVKAELLAERASLEQACRLLKEARESQGLSLADVSQRTGMSRGAISRLENLVDRNPTMATLSRLADALGRRVVISLERAK